MCFFVASICAVISIRSLVLAMDDAVGALVVFSGCLLVFKTLNARMFVQASLTYICLFNVVHLWCDEYLLFYFCKEE